MKWNHWSHLRVVSPTENSMYVTIVFFFGIPFVTIAVL